jgi:hypothetical protein
MRTLVGRGGVVNYGRGICYHVRERLAIANDTISNSEDNPASDCTEEKEESQRIYVHESELLSTAGED